MKKPAKVIDFAVRKQARQVLEAFDRIEHEANKQREEKRAEVERKARNAN